MHDELPGTAADGHGTIRDAHSREARRPPAPARLEELRAVGDRFGQRRRHVHVSLFIADLGGGGAERMMVHLASGLASRGLQVDLVLAQATGPYLANVPSSVRLVDLRGRSVSAAIPALTGYLRRERPDILVATLRYVSLAAAIAHALARTDTLFFVREASTPSIRPPRSVKGRAVGRLMRWTYDRAEGILAVSEGVARDVTRIEGIPPEKVSTLYNPVVTPDIEKLAVDDPEHPWFTTEGPPVVLGAGSMRSEKDFPTLIAAFAILRRTLSARLVILGEGPQRSELERLARETGFEADIDMPGFAANPFAFMARSSVFALSSVVEGLPGVLIQAMACGCPVVSTDCPSGPAEVLDGGRHGRLVPMRDPEALAAAIAATLRSPPATTALRSRAGAYAADRVVSAHLALFKGALEARHSRARRSDSEL